MLFVQVICLGKLKEKYYIAACEEYQKRLGAFCKLQIIELAEQESAAAICKRIPSGAYVIPLCIEGDMLASEALAEKIRHVTNGGVSKLTFLIGGSDGLPEEIKAQADLRLSMSRMTFPHHFARVMLLEQIYRAFQIMSGGKYHKY